MSPASDPLPWTGTRPVAGLVIPRPSAFLLLLALGLAGPPVADATLSGAVSEEDTGDPVAGLGVLVYDIGGLSVAGTETDDSGFFSFNGLLPGIYYVGTAHYFAPDGRKDLLDELFDDVPCPLGCKAVTGTPILLGAGGAAFVEIALSTGGRVAGTVADQAAGEPLPNVQVHLFDTTGTAIANGVTGPEGSYVVGRLPAGVYFARTLNEAGFLDQLYEGTPCPFGRCNPIHGTPVVVALGRETRGTDFTLRQGGRLSGTVVDAANAEPIAGIGIFVYDGEGAPLTRAATDAEGRYVVGGLAAGGYVLRTADAAGFLGELYDGVPCGASDCDPATGTRVTVNPGSEAGGIDFALQRGGGVSGTVTARESGNTRSGVTVSVQDERRFNVSVRTDREGGYRVDGLRAGRYFVRASSSSELVDELYDRIPCPRGSCDLAAGTPVVVERGEEVRIDFQLATGGSVSGRVLAEDSGEPLADIFVLIADSDGVAASDHSDQDGRYRATGLPAGSYIASTLHSGDFFSYVFGGGPCPVVGPCDGVTGEPIRVEAGAETGNVDFSLVRGLSVSGRVFLGDFGFGLPNVFVALFDQAGMPITSTATDDLGLYRISPLPAGTFFARAGTQFTGLHTDAGLLEKLYRDVPCPFATCDVTAGTPIVLEEGFEATGVDFAMAQGGVISGSLTDEATGQPIRRPAFVEIFDSSGIRVTADSVDRNGNFRVGALPTGTYFARVPSASGFIGELYGGRPCVVDCDVAAGVPVAVASGSETSGIDFQLTLGGGFEGTIFREGAVERFFVRIEVFDAQGSLLGSVIPAQPVSLVSRDSASYRVGGLPPGSYFVRAEAPGVVGELFGGGPCPLKCDPRAGTPVTVDADGTTEGVDFHLAAGGSLSGSVTDAATGEGVAGLAVLVYDAEGRRLGIAESGPDGYAVDGLPAGTYFVRALASRGYRGELFDGTPCPFPSCRATAGTPVVVAVGEETGGIDFALEKRAD